MLKIKSRIVCGEYAEIKIENDYHETLLSAQELITIIENLKEGIEDLEYTLTILSKKLKTQ